MNPDLKRKWVEALRSGCYAQGQKYLRQTTDGGDTYCCLGVLCDVIDRSRWLHRSRGDGKAYRWDRDARAVNSIPFDEAQAIGLGGKIQNVLMHMNDMLGCTFYDIAYYIEKHV